MPPGPTAPSQSKPETETNTLLEAPLVHRTNTTAMATEVHLIRSPQQSPHHHPRRMTLPPIQALQAYPPSPLFSPTAGMGFLSTSLVAPLSSSLSFPVSFQAATSRSTHYPGRPGDYSHPVSPMVASAHSSPGSQGSYRGLKRSYEDMASSIEGFDWHTKIGVEEADNARPRSIPRRALAPPLSDVLDYTPNGPPFPMGEMGSMSSGSTSTGTTSSLPAISMSTTFSSGQSESSPISNTQRCSLYIRQQPRAARAGPDGRDRRSLDPPPVVQLIMSDFDPDSPSDSPRKDLSTLSKVTEDGSKEIQRLLLGTAVSSPFFCQDDPDPEHAPSHPTTSASSSSNNNVTTTQSSGPPSPTSRFLPPSIAKASEDKMKGSAAASGSLPATFFIFADLSVRKAGEYRLEFSLMKMDAAIMTPGSTVPIIHSITSHVFKVVNAKDFDQVQPSTDLVKGLLEKGAGFPLKLKKGTREGQRRRPNREGSEDDEDEDEDE